MGNHGQSRRSASGIDAQEERAEGEERLGRRRELRSRGEAGKDVDVHLRQEEQRRRRAERERRRAKGRGGTVLRKREEETRDQGQDVRQNGQRGKWRLGRGKNWSGGSRHG